LRRESIVNSPIHPNFSKHRFDEENVMRIPGNSEAQRSRMRDEESIHRRRPCSSWLTPFMAAPRLPHHAAYRSGPGAFDGVTEMNPNT
jgi:hypothetical protein